jgi:1,4-alpha-glucan branching enzyme
MQMRISKVGSEANLPMSLVNIARGKVTGAVTRTAPKRRSAETAAPVEFKLTAPDANSVFVAGDFNDWNSSDTPLRKQGAEWKVALALPRGTYEYRFVVDGTWMSDPAAMGCAANPFGGTNSIVMV